jgi:hypothetical protein
MSGLLFLQVERLQDSVNKEDIRHRVFPWMRRWNDAAMMFTYFYGRGIKGSPYSYFKISRFS